MAQAFLEELLAVSHDARVVRLIAIGKEARTSADAKAKVESLMSGDAFARSLAVWSCFGSGDGGLVLRALHDVSRRVRRLAFRLVPVACDDPQAFDALQLAFGLRRDHRLLMGLQANGRLEVVDRYLDWVAAYPGVHDFADIVPLGSRAARERHLERALERPSAVFWKRLASHDPSMLGDVLARRVEAAAGESDPVTRQLVERYHRHLAKRAPRQALRLAELLDARGILSARIWQDLFDALPEEVAAFHEARPRLGHLAVALRLEPARTVPLALLERLVRLHVGLGFEVKDLEPARRRAVADAWASVCETAPRHGGLLRYVSDDAMRERAFRAWQAAARHEDGTIDVGELGQLPIALAEREARRHLHDVVALATQPSRRIDYAQYLSWDDAAPPLTVFLGHPEGAVRGLALTTLFRTLVHRPEEGKTTIDRALAMVLARKNEQDPVRGQMLAALGAWPREVWSARHTPQIGQVLRDALDASDLSNGTASHGERLLVRSFRLDPAWASALLGTWMKERGRLLDARLGLHLEDEDLRHAAPHIVALAKVWETQEKWSDLINLAQSLADRLALVPGLADVIETARDTVRWGGWAVALTRLLRAHDRPRYERGLPALTRTWLDRGWYGELVGLAQTYEVGDSLDEDLALALERIVDRAGQQIDVVMAVSALRSRANRRFGVRVERMIEKDASLVALPAIYMYLHRRRQDLLGPYLDARPVTGRFATGQSAWLLPFRKDFWRWTTPQCAAFAGQHAAIVASQTRDTPTLLASLSTLPEICWAPMEALTARCDDERPVVKEKAMRVVARCDQGQGVPALLRCLEDERARVAIYGLRRALKDWPPARALDVLAKVPFAKVTVAKEVVRLLGELRLDAAYARLVALDGESLHRDVRIALLRALWDHLEREPTWGIFDRAVTGEDWVMASRLGDIPADRLTRTTDVRLSAVLARVLARPEPEARIDLLRRAPHLAVEDRARVLLAAARARILSVYDDEVDAAVRATMARSDEADIPALEATLDDARADRRTFSVAVTALLRHGVGREVYVLAARAAEEVAARDPALVTLRVRAARSTKTADALATLLTTLAPLSADALLESRAAIDVMPAEHRLGAEAILAASADAELRRLAVHALGCHVNAGFGWTEEALARLAAYRRDPSPIVAGAADFLFPPRELVTPSAGART